MNKTIRHFATQATVLAAVVSATGCRDAFSLRQENPGQLTAGSVYTPANAQLLVDGVIADFQCSFMRYVVGSALLVDELTNATSNTANYDLDRRTQSDVSPYALGCASILNPGFYTGLSTARGTGDEAYRRLEGWTDAEVPNRMRRMAQTAVYSGYAIVLMAEGFCTGAIAMSAELTPAQMFAEAITRFDKSITAATAANDQATLNLARLGRARAQRGAGNLTAAATDAALIPPTFLVTTSNDATNTRLQNFVWLHTVQNFYSSVDPAFRGLTLASGPDPRVPVTNSGRVGNVANTPVWQTGKYMLATAPIAIAKYAEAQLILAEARAEAGDLSGAATAINAARNSGTGRTGIAQYSATGQTAAQVRDQIIEERRRELFLEGHRLGDVRRYNLPLIPAPGAPYVQGGGVYGDQRCFPLPAVEKSNNPNIAK
jgi:starch-binding outer membrane protein, SusD/RagB family